MSNIVDETAAVVERLRAMQSRVDEVTTACREATQAWERIAAAVNAPFRTPMADEVKRGWKHGAQHRSVLGQAADLLERAASEIERLQAARDECHAQATIERPPNSLTSSKSEVSDD